MTTATTAEIARREVPRRWMVGLTSVEKGALGGRLGVAGSEEVPLMSVRLDCSADMNSRKRALPAPDGLSRTCFASGREAAWG
jgi:hypothetical protein